MAHTHEVERATTASNNVLTGVDKCAIRSLIQGAQKELDDRGVEPSRILATREMKFARVVQLECTLSAVRELPNEVLAEIFSLLSETVNIEKLNDLSLAPWNISQVCSRWRGVTLLVSTLWNDVAVDYNLADDDDQRVLTQKLGKFLSRSGQALISLCVCAKPPAHLRKLFSSRLASILAPYADRLRHLDLEPAESIPFILDISPGLMQSVNSLELWFDAEALPLNITSRQFPALRKVTLASLQPRLPVHFHPEVFHLPWAQLTYLSMDNITFRTTRSLLILSHCHNLVTCSLELQSDVGLQPENIMVMPRLETLRTLASGYRGAYGYFFSLLVAPMLREFILLSSLHNNIVWSDEALATFVSHSCVERLVTTVSIHKLPTLLQGMPSLLHLISQEPIDSSTLAAISNGRLFPQLETLVCGGFSDFDKMMDMLEHRSWYSRMTGDSDEFKTLKSMTYCAPSILLMSNSWQERLQKLQTDGLHVDWRDEIDISEFDL